MSISGGPFTAINNRARLQKSIELLGYHVASTALYDSAERHSPPKCHPHTREVVLKRITEWVDAPANRGHFMWITGSPGVGKSAVAETIAEIYLHAGKLAAACFFSRKFTGRTSGNSRNFIATLAYQLFHAIPEVQDGLKKKLQDHPDLFTFSLPSQAQALIIEPLNAVVATAADNHDLLESRPRVVVIDALDECPEQQGQERILEMLTIFSGLQFPLTFLVASRLEQSIQEAFDREPLHSLTTRLDLDMHNPESDIKLFLQSKFHEIKRDHPGGHELPTPWPSEEQIGVLVERSSGQFRYATTVIEFVGSLHHPPSYRLDLVLSPLVGPEISSSPLEALQHQIAAATKKHANSSWFSLANIGK